MIDTMRTDILIKKIKGLTHETVTIVPTRKGNRILTGVCIGNGNIRPTVYLEDFDEECGVHGYDYVAYKIIKMCQETKVPPFDINSVVSWDYVKENLILCVAPAGTLDGYVTIPYLDLELYFRVNVSYGGTYKIAENHLEMWGVTKSDLLKIVTHTNGYEVLTMTEVMMEEMVKAGLTDDEIADLLFDADEVSQIVITNESRTFGASAIFNKELLKDIADKYENDLYVIPSSIHEIIVVPCNEHKKKEMDDMVMEINMSSVSLEKQLADHVYVFRKDTMEIVW